MHNREQLVYWRVNVDFQFILDEERAIKYMAKYTANPEQRSRNVKEMFKKILSASEDESPQKLIRSLMF
jgi:hypothetical protein